MVGYHDAHSIELNPNTMHPVIALMPDQNGVEDIGGTLRLGAYPCKLKEGSLARKLYGEELIYERHRHRYEVNNDFRKLCRTTGCPCPAFPRTAILWKWRSCRSIRFSSRLRPSGV